MENVMPPRKYPRRVEYLKKKLEEMNGDDVSASESRRLVKYLAESHLDLWDYVLSIDDKLKKRDLWAWTTRNVLPGVIVGISVALVLHFIGI